MKNKVILLSRSYNDVDCRLPLLLEFAKDGRYKVEIIGIPSNAGLHDPRKHELSAYLEENGVSISTLYDHVGNKPLIRAAIALYGFLDRLFDGALSGDFTEGLKRGVFRLVFALSVHETLWVDLIRRRFRDAIVLLDEIAYQGGRSFFIDEVLRQAEAGGYSLYSFLVGQDPYLNLWHDRKIDAVFQLKKRVGVPLYVPGPNDKEVMEKKLPGEEVVVAGNTRFDAAWIRTLSGLASKRIQRIDLLQRPAQRRVVFMLSKIEYGVDLKNIIEAMNVCAALPGAHVIVKPHTRGMSIGALGAGLDSRVVNGAALSSSDLIQWADAVMFTGSSIAFQAIQLGKRVVYLKHCQRYQSIFDDSGAVLIANGIDDVRRFVESGPAGRLETGAIDRFLTTHIYNGSSAGDVCRMIKEKLEKVEQRELSHAS